MNRCITFWKETNAIYNFWRNNPINSKNTKDTTEMLCTYVGTGTPVCSVPCKKAMWDSNACWHWHQQQKCSIGKRDCDIPKTTEDSLGLVTCVYHLPRKYFNFMLLYLNFYNQLSEINFLFIFSFSSKLLTTPDQNVSQAPGNKFLCSSLKR